jgi:hypothetical protein
VTDHLTPSPELVQQWQDESPETQIADHIQYLATRAAQWGADQELEACCRWLPKLPPWSANDLRKHRRPKPLSLKKQALKVLESAPGPDYPSVMTILDADQHALIRTALEALDD